MTSHETILAEVRTDVKWLVQAHKQDAVAHKEFYVRLDSLEKTRAKFKGGAWVMGIACSISATAYGVYIRLFGV